MISYRGSACRSHHHQGLGGTWGGLLGLFVLLPLLGGCWSDAGTNPVFVQESRVGPAGGTVTYKSPEHDVSLVLTFPPGALDAATLITIEHAPSFPDAEGLVAAAVFRFLPDDLAFTAPVVLTIAYGQQLIGDLSEADLRIHRADVGGWIPMLGQVDTANHRVSTTLDGFSIYGLKTMAAPQSGGAGDGSGTDGTDGGGADTGTDGGATDTGGDAGDAGGSGGGGDGWARIQAEILQARCVLCHNNGPFAPMGLSWEADQYATVVTDGKLSGEVPSLKIIEPGDSGASYMAWKIIGQGPQGEPIDGVRMPASGPPYLSQAEIDRIVAWIDAGAPLAASGGATDGGGTDTGGGTDPGTGGGGTDPGTGGGDPGAGDGGATDPAAIVPTWYGVQANILERFCTLCHSGAAPPMGLSWEVDQYDANIASGRLSGEVATMKIVEPGDPNASYMYWKITGNPGIQGVRMPATGIPLEQPLIDVIEQWILDGAPLGDPADADAGAAEPSFPVGSWMYVWSEALQICTMCHSLTPSSPRCGTDFECPPKGVVLTADNYSNVVDGSIVRPSSPDGSKLWERVTETDPDKRMPFGLDPLTQPQLDIIRAWILDGAPFCPDGEVCP